ncbi:MAG: ferritin-like domain-containing protein [Proteobacteria bacterium]|nr:ferritin-like domain-containing protein [Pseudomonadota bacterium]
MSPRPTHVTAFCQSVLTGGSLEAKLAPPRTETGEPLPDREPGSAIGVAAPARDPGLQLASGAPPLPRPHALADPKARAACLARFAHHELQAVELFAWALLRFPAVPAGLRRGWLQVLEDEQRHCRLYLERLQALGSRLEEHPLSDYFWKHVPAIEGAHDGPRAFLAAMGLTLEQANLDFSALYEAAFRAAGDEASADVCRQVHEDEIRHVRIARVWLERLSPPPRDALRAYRECVPFPLSAARAKGRRFDAEARRRAGLSEPFIDAVRRARSTAERAGRPRGTCSS